MLHYAFLYKDVCIARSDKREAYLNEKMKE